MTARSEQIILDSYALMGRAGVSLTDPGVAAFVAANSSPQDVWAAALPYLNDPTWGPVAANAQTILNALSAGALGVDIEACKLRD